ncbi:MAG: hypothetical protein HS126_37625 [Anaerolineales bacterium]|nr:hypothetical protein [Anaerolineales bacterium]
MDPQSLKKLVKLEAVIAETEPLIEQGRYLHGQNHDSLVVKPEEQLYFWNSRTGNKPGDIYAWLMELNGWTFAEALADVAGRAGIELPEKREQPARSPPPRSLSPHTARRLAPPSSAWQKRGQELVTAAQANLWSEAGRPGLDELHRRGLTDATLRWAGLGWNPADIWDEPEAWGFSGGRKSGCRVASSFPGSSPGSSGASGSGGPTKSWAKMALATSALASTPKANGDHRPRGAL